jgi:hypothetical protein
MTCVLIGTVSRATASCPQILLFLCARASVAFIVRSPCQQRNQTRIPSSVPSTRRSSSLTRAALATSSSPVTRRPARRLRSSLSKYRRKKMSSTGADRRCTLVAPSLPLMFAHRFEDTGHTHSRTLPPEPIRPLQPTRNHEPSAAPAPPRRQADGGLSRR